MKNNAVLINVSRAQLVDQKALYRALKNNKIAGAGLDVYIYEPTTGDEPLLQLPNVVATPHMAGSTYDTYNIARSTCVLAWAYAEGNFKPTTNFTSLL